ncbi:MAG: radical SAM family heme chaperone HemW [Chloroflexota bacterium]|nr:radical SAM family heme chaperone HemW [Chloroflexota bacterium]
MSPLSPQSSVLSPIPDLDPAVAPFGIYLHVPFCVHKCRYCDFVTYSGREALIPAYVDALLAEIAAAPGRWPGPLPPVSSVFWGGGTPSLLPPDAFRRVHDRIAAVFGWRGGDRGGVEITVEANPETVDEVYWRGLREAGVGRISLGVQSFQPAGLRALDRAHDPGGAVAALEAARRAGIDNVSFDLIFGWAGQTAADWAADLRQAVALAPRHLSLYALTVEERTPLAADIARGRVPAPDDDRQADFYEAATETLDAAGYEGYEISNWARRPGPGEAPGRWRSRHNSLYWRNGEYLGFGVGAHSHFRGRRFGNGRLVRRYIERVAAGAHAPASEETIDSATAMAETMMLGLRLTEGVSRAAFRARHGHELDAIYGPQLAELAALGLLHDAGDAVRLTGPGRLVANEALVRFLKD